MTDRPNILLILSDQHNVRLMGCEGNPIIRTPGLDKLASEGVRFDNAYCQNPLCAPSRFSMLSGQYCKTLGIYNNRHIPEANSMTLPRALGAAGYATCLIGKAHFNGEQFHGYQQRPYGDLYGQAHQPDPRRTPEEGPEGHRHWFEKAGPTGIPLPLTQTEICLAEASKWLQERVGVHGEQPFFLTVSFDKPHFPVNPPKEYFEHYIDKVELPEVPEGCLEKSVNFVREATMDNGKGEWYGKSPELHRKLLAAYYGCIEWVDDAIGRLLDTLDYLGLAENTIVIYSTDHGDMSYENGAWQKTVFFDASARVPLIVRWPRQIVATGTRLSQPAGLLDLFPTLCEAAGVAIPAQCEGTSLLPLLTKHGNFERDAIFSESTVLGNPVHAGCMIRTGDWKYNHYLDGDDELYNLKDDPMERKNLITDPAHAALAETLKNRVIAFWEPDKQYERYNRTPMMYKQKDAHEFSNQFMLGAGLVFDGRP